MIYNISRQLMYYGNAENRINVVNYLAGIYLVKIRKTRKKFIRR